jgi:hypothetical protein
MNYSEFINLKLPIKTIALLGGNINEFDKYCSFALRMWGDNKSDYLRKSGYEYVWCTCDDDVIGIIFNEYFILPETKMSDKIYKLIQIVEDDGVVNEQQPILPAMW